MVKKVLALLLLLNMLLCVTACSSKDNISDILSDEIIPNETTQSQIEETTDNTESEVSIPTTTTSSQTQVVVQPTPQPQHTHSYTISVKAATCTEQGYTTYVCSCGNTYNDNYVEPTHKFINYVCSVCNEIDKTNMYNYLTSWIVKYGTTEGQFSKISYIDQSNGINSIVYQAKDNSVLLQRSSVSSDYLYYVAINMNKIADTYEYFFACKDLTAENYPLTFSGKIKANNFTCDTPIYFEEFSSDIGMSVENVFLERARLDLNTILIVVDGLLHGELDSPNNSGLDISDLGFINFE